MQTRPKLNHTLIAQLVGAIVVMAVVMAATMWMSAGATVVTDQAVDKVGGFYLQELAGHRTQVISGSLEERFEQMRRAMKLMAEEGVDTQEEVRAFIGKIEDLYDLEQFAVVDEDNVVYARYATYMGGSRYGFLTDGSLREDEVMSSTSMYGANRQVCLALAVSGQSIGDKPLKACFGQVNINHIVQTLSTEELETGTSFCIYHRNGDNLTKLDFGPISSNMNLFGAMKGNLTQDELSRLKSDFENGTEGKIEFDYEGNKQTLFYEPIPNSHWLLTVLVADHLIQDQIRGVGDEMLTRSTVLIAITALLLLVLFGTLVYRMRKQTEAELEKEREISKNAGKRAAKSERELGTVREVAYKDALTGVNSRYSYAKEELRVDEKIRQGIADHFALVVCDIDNLKTVNDEQGHAAGDEYIKSACRTICKMYDHSPVYRIGGDEFVILLKGDDYMRRTEILATFNEKAEENLAHGEVVVASGMAEFKSEDTELHDVFERADRRMYERKAQLKHMEDGLSG